MALPLNEDHGPGLTRGVTPAAGRGILVDAQLDTAPPGIFVSDAAGWPGGKGGAAMRAQPRRAVERRDRVAAGNMPGASRPFRDVPFFRGAHHETATRPAGHAEAGNEAAIDGGIAARDAGVSPRKKGRTPAAATIGRAGALGQGQPLAGPA